MQEKKKKVLSRFVKYFAFGISLVILCVIILVLWFLYSFQQDSKKDAADEKAIEIMFHEKVNQLNNVEVEKFMLWEGDSMVTININGDFISFWYGVDGIPRIESIKGKNTEFDCFYVDDKGTKKSYAHTMNLTLNSESELQKWFNIEINSLEDLVAKYKDVEMKLAQLPNNPQLVDFQDRSGNRKVIVESNQNYLVSTDGYGDEVQCDLYMETLN